MPHFFVLSYFLLKIDPYDDKSKDEVYVNKILSDDDVFYLNYL